MTFGFVELFPRIWIGFIPIVLPYTTEKTRHEPEIELVLVKDFCVCCWLRPSNSCDFEHAAISKWFFAGFAMRELPWGRLTIHHERWTSWMSCQRSPCWRSKLLWLEDRNLLLSSPKNSCFFLNIVYTSLSIQPLCSCLNSSLKPWKPLGTRRTCCVVK